MALSAVPGSTTADCCHLTSGSNNSSYDSCFPIQGEYFSRFMSSLSFTRAKYFSEILLVYLSSPSNLNECSNFLQSSFHVFTLEQHVPAAPLCSEKSSQ